jgi:hypothetical protein
MRCFERYLDQGKEKRISIIAYIADDKKNQRGIIDRLDHAAGSDHANFYAELIEGVVGSAHSMLPANAASQRSGSLVRSRTCALRRKIRVPRCDNL